MKRLFTSDYQPKKRGKGPKKGVRPLKKIIEAFLFTDIEWQDLEGKPKKMQVIDVMVANQIKKACEGGDLASFKELMDRYFGRIQDVAHHPEDITITKVVFAEPEKEE